MGCGVARGSPLEKSQGADKERRVEGALAASSFEGDGFFAGGEGFGAEGGEEGGEPFLAALA